MRTKTLFIVFMSLVFANFIYFIWAQDFLSPLGFSSHAHLETERLQRQLEPDHIIVGLNKTTPADNKSSNDVKSKASSASSMATDLQKTEAQQAVKQASASVATISSAIAASSPSRTSSSAQATSVGASNTVVASLVPPANAQNKNSQLEDINSATLICQQSALLSAKQVADIKPFLQKKLPANSWKISQLKVQSGWLVYMGKYPDKKEFAKKEQELKSRGIDFDIVKNPKLQPGFVLASFDSEDKANDAKRSLVHFGIRTAKVVEDETRQPNSILVLPKTSKALKPQLDELKNQLPSRWLGPCDKNTLR